MPVKAGHGIRLGYLVAPPADATERRAAEPSALAGKAIHRAPSIPDLVIAATAQLAGLTVLHVEKDFDLIADITDQSMERLRLLPE